MNDANPQGPCAEFEHDIVELVDGALTADRALAVRRHVEACPRCGAWHDEFAALDGRLSAALPRPELSAGFGARLSAELQAMTRSTRRVDLLAEEESRYRSILDTLRAGARRNMLASAVTAVGVAACSVPLARDLLPHLDAMLPGFAGGTRATMLGAAGVAIALGALAWSSLRGAMPTLRLPA